MSQSGELDVIANHPEIPTQFDADTGMAIPIANILNISGNAAQGVSTSGSGNTITITVANATTSSKGVAEFNPAQFSVTAGVVSSTTSTIEEWTDISASQTMAVNNGYICESGGVLSLLLPPVSSVGDLLEVTLDGSAGFTITQGAGQSIRLGNDASTAGVGGSISSTQQGDSLRMVCSIANLKWNVLSTMGNPTIV